MTKIVIDSNIIFSALVGKNSRTRGRILKSDDRFYSPNFLISEIFKHKERILRKSKANEDETYELLVKILNKVNFINEENIKTENFIRAYQLCKDIDEKDTPFVALSLELELKLWTRDEVLKSGLVKKGFHNFFNEKI